MPQGKHSRIQGEFVPTINGVVKPKKIACAFPELRCTFGGRSTVPDVVVFVWSRIPSDELLPTPSFVSELNLTVKDLFSWLLL
jgi:Uma2 family endonuclease